MSNAIGSFVGTIGRDPEIKKGQNGDFAVFSIAVDVAFGKDDVPPMWVNCSAFGKQTDVVMKYAKKGSQVFLTGAISLNTYQSQDGPKTTLQLNVQSFQFVGQRRAGGGGYNRGGGGGYGGNRGYNSGGQRGGYQQRGYAQQAGQRDRGGYDRGGEPQHEYDEAPGERSGQPAPSDDVPY
jgi:single-strand DNA-binding protein